ncbi:ATP-grasp domain-containing protein [Candidatus Latescibacterota bacterium]
MERYVAVLGGNELACPAIEHLERLGYRTLVLDRNTDAPARRVASEFVPVDFSDSSATVAAVAPFELRGVLALNDFGVISAAQLAESRGLPGYTQRAAHRLTNKIAMKNCWRASRLPIPNYTWMSTCELLAGGQPSWDHYPCIAKPAFSGGGSRGVFLAESLDHLRRGVRDTQSDYRVGQVLIEEYVIGSEHTVEVLVVAGVPHVLSISDKLNYPRSVAIVQRLTFPGPRGHHYRAQIEGLVSSACTSLELDCGCAHFEVLVRDGSVLLLEVGGRPGGGPNFHPICRLSTGFDYPLELARVLTGESPTLQRHVDAVCLGWHYFSLPQGRLTRIIGFEGVAQDPSVVDARLEVEAGEVVADPENDLRRPGYILVQAGDYQQLEERVHELQSRIQFIVEEDHETP